MDRRWFLRSTAGIGAGAVAGAAALRDLVSPAAAGAETALSAAEKAPLPPPPVALEPGNIPYWLQVRNSFPVLRDPLYVNNGGLGPSPYEAIHVLKSMIDQQELECSTLHSGALWDSVKAKAGLCLGCDADEVAYTRNATEGINIVANGIKFKKGDELITTTHEHVGNTIAWLARAERDGLVIKTFTPSMVSAEENIKLMEKLITKRTKAFNVTHVSTIGQLMPVNEIGKLAAKHGIYYFVDGAQAPGMMPVDVRAMGCHAYATSGHKWLLGPKGTGLLYVKKDALDMTDAKFVGAYSAAGKFDMTTGEYHLTDTAQRYEYGTVNAPLFASLGASMGFLLRIGLDNVWAHNHALARAFMEGLTQLGARIITPLHPDEHSSMITFKLDGVTQAHLGKVLREEAKLVIRGIYEGGYDAIRISFHAYNNFDDVDQVLGGVRAAKG